MSEPACLRVQADNEIWLAVKVQPRASKNEIGDVVGGELKIKVTAPPVDSAANEALLRFLAEKLNTPRSALRLVRGGTSRHKIVGISGLDASKVAERLGCCPISN
jgi:uncharacterized protein (TIGR00251 family)